MRMSPGPAATTYTTHADGQSAHTVSKVGQITDMLDMIGSYN